MKSPRIFLAVVLTFIILIGVDAYAAKISGKMCMRNMEFSMKNEGIKVLIDSIFVEYTVNFPDGWSGKVLPCAKVVVEKRPGDESFRSYFWIVPKLDPTVNYGSELHTYGSFGVYFNYPDQMKEGEYLLTEGVDYNSYPQYRVYENVDNEITNQDYNFDATQVAQKHDNNLPTNFELRQNYPNPFNASTTIDFDLPEDANIRLSIYNNYGQLVEILADRFYQKGTRSINWDASRYSSGIYYYQIEADAFRATKKCILLR